MTAVILLAARDMV